MATGGFAKGRKAWGHCQRCGFRFLLNMLVHDGQIQGLLVCDSCFDPKHPLETIPSLSDPIALHNATGDMDKLNSNPITVFEIDFLNPGVFVDGVFE